MNYAEAIKKALEARQAAGETVYSMSRESGIPQPTIHRFLSGERDLRLANADRLGEYLGIVVSLPKKVKKFSESSR